MIEDSRPIYSLPAETQERLQQRLDCSSIFKQITRRKWTKLCTQPPPGNLNLVREIYALAQEKEFSVEIHGKTVAWSGMAINEFLGLDPFQYDEWPAIFKETNHDKVADLLCPGGTAWVPTTEDEFSGLAHDRMTFEAKAWVKFICARLMPTTTYSTVKYELCALAYHILEGTLVHIGLIIMTQIQQCLRSKRVGLYFPSLITQLCLHAGVPTRDGEERVLTKGPIHISPHLKNKEIQCVQYPT